MLELVDGRVGGWVGWGGSWQEAQAKPVRGGRGGEDEGAGSPGPAPVPATCPGPAVWGARETLPRMPSAESGLLVSACQQRCGVETLSPGSRLPSFRWED